MGTQRTDQPGPLWIAGNVLDYCFKGIFLAFFLPQDMIVGLLLQGRLKLVEYRAYLFAKIPDGLPLIGVVQRTDP